MCVDESGHFSFAAEVHYLPFGLENSVVRSNSNSVKLHKIATVFVAGQNAC